MGELIQLDALGPAGSYRARNRMMIPDVSGRPVAELSLVPSLFVRRGLGALHRAGTMPADRRAAALAHAGQLFATGVVDGRSREAHEHTVSRVCGLPISVVHAATGAIALAAQEAYTSAHAARPGAAVDDWRDPLTRQGRALWTRRGDVFAVHAAGNHPAPHSLWLEALALGYRVALRPSRREPFTPHRLILALRAAGFPDDSVLLLPTDHRVAEEIIDSADLAMVYGGDDVVDELDDGSAALRPAVLQLDRPQAPQAGIELPFPCVWVAPWSPGDGIGPVRNSLVLTAITSDEELLDQLVEDPTISNVYVGDHPTHRIRPGLPHDRYLGEFLMRTKAMIRD